MVQTNRALGLLLLAGVPTASARPNLDRLFQHADQNGDDAISLAEMRAASAQRFANADADGDGTVTREERRADHTKTKTAS